MHHLLGGLIYAVANSPSLSLNFYPILGELGNISDRLAKLCKWSTTLYKILKENAKSLAPRYSNEDVIQDWCRSVKDTDLGNNLRLFVHQFVPVPPETYDQNMYQEER